MEAVWPHGQRRGAPHIERVCLDRRLAFISARAAVSKTALMTGWATECSVPVAWLSLDVVVSCTLLWRSALLCATRAADVVEMTPLVTRGCKLHRSSAGARHVGEPGPD